MNTFLGIATVLAVLALGVRLGGRQHRLLHLFQLEHYEPARLMLWLRRRNELFAPRELAPIAVLYAAAIALAAIGGSGSGWVSGGLLLLWHADCCTRGERLAPARRQAARVHRPRPAPARGGAAAVAVAAARSRSRSPEPG